ncbi:hypothetical protein [Cellulosimicrobium sp. CUA-896]|uniref:hypothetical protein n=1 Tax=Cellulosimicrobium sp. CUA-896 TaxID=1517881 RepID=UPI001C9E64B6|nr:hypothetical protein [Cellulosimicrobium sp. CUA-896]
MLKRGAGPVLNPAGTYLVESASTGSEAFGPPLSDPSGRMWPTIFDLSVRTAVSDEDAPLRRVRFFGPDDLAAGVYVGRVAELVEHFDTSNVPVCAMDVIELHNVQQYIEHGLLPHDFTESERAIARARVGQIQSVVARFFSAVDDANCADVMRDVKYEYHRDLLDLLGRNKAFERCSAAAMQHALRQADVRMGDILACKKLVAAYGGEIRDAMLEAPRNAEHLVRKYMERDARVKVYLPATFTPADARDLLERYVDSPNANPNYVGLIETAPVNASTGVDAKLKLRAKRRNAEMTEKFFEETIGLKVGTEVALSDAQDEPAKFEMDESGGLVARFTYSTRWLDSTRDNPSILNNFQHLFEFGNDHVLLTLPSYPAQLGVFERFMSMSGVTHYQVGVGFPGARMEQLPSNAAIPALLGGERLGPGGSHRVVL